MNRFKVFKLCCFLIVVAVGAAIPLCKVWEFECPKEAPVELKFTVAGQDPRDPVRGHYLALNFVDRSVPVAERLNLRNRCGYVLLEQQPDGTAVAVGFATERPTEQQLYVAVRSIYPAYNNSSDTGLRVNFRYPFDRFYLNEDRIEAAEKLLRAGKLVQLVVRLHRDGNYEVADLLIDNVSISQLLAEPESR